MVMVGEETLPLIKSTLKYRTCEIRAKFVRLPDVGGELIISARMVAVPLPLLLMEIGR